MYGSCATDLDLPSSDLDVVVRGLDKAEQDAMAKEKQSMKTNNSEVRKEREVDARVGIKGKTLLEKGRDISPLQPGHLRLQHPKLFSHITTNSERVVTLALELERQPWAVHVKAIPTASVPVIKILADPARLQGPTVGNQEWLVQQSQISRSPVDISANDDNSDLRSQYPSSPSHLPWRGADVVNGLLKVDITFEGPEHGGIGSTKFSKRVVDDFSKESGLPPDGTAAVQVLMVLKELLAQRRLNEPFSGGLSSYALLLLVISVVRERAIIRKELERVERQRILVAAGGGNAVLNSGTSEMETSYNDNSARNGQSFTETRIQKTNTDFEAIAKSSKHFLTQKSVKGGSSTYRVNNENTRMPTNQTLVESKSINGHDAATLKSGGSASSSWASIARKTSHPISKKAGQDSTVSANSPETKKKSLKNAGSFAEAVTKGSTLESHVDRETTAKTSDMKVNDAVSEKGKKSDGNGGTTVDGQNLLDQNRRKNSSLPVGAPTKQNTASVADESGSFFPQSFHDVIEVLCSGETTPGKLLMHFLLFYGQHFDSHSTAIDYSNTHKRDPNANGGYAVASPYLQRRNTGSYDPVTGMLTVDPIVVYDPLEGAESNNVARSCFAWSSIRWVFAQSYMTLSSAVEMSAGHFPGQANSRAVASHVTVGNANNETYPAGQEDAVWGGVPYGHDESGNVILDPATPLLELLLSF